VKSVAVVDPIDHERLHFSIGVFPVFDIVGATAMGSRTTGSSIFDALEPTNYWFANCQAPMTIKFLENA